MKIVTIKMVTTHRIVLFRSRLEAAESDFDTAILLWGIPNYFLK
jgi:hypothetical protein